MYKQKVELNLKKEKSAGNFPEKIGGKFPEIFRKISNFSAEIFRLTSLPAAPAILGSDFHC